MTSLSIVAALRDRLPDACRTRVGATSACVSIAMTIQQFSGTAVSQQRGDGGDSQRVRASKPSKLTSKDRADGIRTGALSAILRATQGVGGSTATDRAPTGAGSSPGGTTRGVDSPGTAPLSQEEVAHILKTVHAFGGDGSQQCSKRRMIDCIRSLGHFHASYIPLFRRRMFGNDHWDHDITVALMQRAAAYLAHARGLLVLQGTSKVAGRSSRAKKRHEGSLDAMLDSSLPNLRRVVSGELMTPAVVDAKVARRLASAASYRNPRSNAVYARALYSEQNQVRDAAASCYNASVEQWALQDEHPALDPDGHFDSHAAHRAAERTDILVPYLRVLGFCGQTDKAARVLRAAVMDSGLWPSRRIVHAMMRACIDAGEFVKAWDWYSSMFEWGCLPDLATRRLLASLIVAAERSGQGPALRAHVRGLVFEMGIMADEDRQTWGSSGHWSAGSTLASAGVHQGRDGGLSQSLSNHSSSNNGSLVINGSSSDSEAAYSGSEFEAAIHQSNLQHGDGIDGIQNGGDDGESGPLPLETYVHLLTRPCDNLHGDKSLMGFHAASSLDVERGFGQATTSLQPVDDDDADLDFDIAPPDGGASYTSSGSNADGALTPAAAERLDLLDLSLHFVTSLAWVDEEGRFFKTLWRDDVRAMIVRCSVSGDEASSIIAPASGSARAAIRIAYKRLKSKLLNDARTAQRNGVRGSLGNSTAGSFGPSQNAADGDVNADDLHDDAASSRRSITDPALDEPAVEWPAHVSVAVNQRAAQKIENILIRIIEANQSGTDAVAKMRALLAQRCGDIITVMQDSDIQPDARVISAYIKAIIMAGHSHQLRPVLSILASSPSGHAFSLIDAAIRSICVPLYAGRVYQALPELVTVGIRPSEAVLHDLMIAATRAWVAAQSDSCPTCGLAAQSTAADGRTDAEDASRQDSAPSQSRVDGGTRTVDAGAEAGNHAQLTGMSAPAGAGGRTVAAPLTRTQQYEARLRGSSAAVQSAQQQHHQQRMYSSSSLLLLPASGSAGGGGNIVNAAAALANLQKRLAADKQKLADDAKRKAEAEKAEAEKQLWARSAPVPSAAAVSASKSTRGDEKAPKFDEPPASAGAAATETGASTSGPADNTTAAASTSSPFARLAALKRLVGGEAASAPVTPIVSAAPASSVAESIVAASNSSGGSSNSAASVSAASTAGKGGDGRGKIESAADALANLQKRLAAEKQKLADAAKRKAEAETAEQAKQLWARAAPVAPASSSSAPSSAGADVNAPVINARTANAANVADAPQVVPAPESIVVASGSAGTTAAAASDTGPLARLAALKLLVGGGAARTVTAPAVTPAAAAVQQQEPAAPPSPLAEQIRTNTNVPASSPAASLDEPPAVSTAAISANGVAGNTTAAPSGTAVASTSSALARLAALKRLVGGGDVTAPDAPAVNAAATQAPTTTSTVVAANESATPASAAPASPDGVPAPPTPAPAPSSMNDRPIAKSILASLASFRPKPVTPTSAPVDAAASSPVSPPVSGKLNGAAVASKTPLAAPPLIRVPGTTTQFVKIMDPSSAPKAASETGGAAEGEGAEEIVIDVIDQPASASLQASSSSAAVTSASGHSRGSASRHQQHQRSGHNYGGAAVSGRGNSINGGAGRSRLRVSSASMPEISHSQSSSSSSAYLRGSMHQQLTSSIKCAGANSLAMSSHDPSAKAVYPSMQLAVLSATGLLHRVPMEALIILATSAANARCAREAWAAWQSIKVVQAHRRTVAAGNVGIASGATPSSPTQTHTSAPTSPALLHGLMTTFASGGLAGPAWQAYLELYPFHTGPLPDLVTMAGMEPPVAAVSAEQQPELVFGAPGGSVGQGQGNAARVELR